jgi:hypothetical protein
VGYMTLTSKNYGIARGYPMRFRAEGYGRSSLLSSPFNSDFSMFSTQEHS